MPCSFRQTPRNNYTETQSEYRLSSISSCDKNTTDSSVVEKSSRKRPAPPPPNEFLEENAQQKPIPPPLSSFAKHTNGNTVENDSSLQTDIDVAKQLPTANTDAVVYCDTSMNQITPKVSLI